ncbi:sel1 repeat family protein [Synechococcales cyanobacterium C]|uniref:Sel1 repeat family protein n=1 Tax=Petrachloros mirabilis ULC683 TaxID=2781853 RepID=A0A8K1ZWI1_9CYAN|nr:tetratricopeptide repeat protein [Petrachloros mirabilis]NCJ04957.1 sel1 repeat family protein [Petrachloros mirabilis ULC683]
MSNLENGQAAFEAEDYINAFRLLKPIAEQGNAEAQCVIANMYQLGLGLERDFSEAIHWYEKSAEQGYGVASNNLAEIFRSGACGIAANQEKAEKWYHKAREQEFLHTRRNFLSNNS